MSSLHSNTPDPDDPSDGTLDGQDLSGHRHLMGLGSLDDDDPNILLAIQLSLQESGMVGGGASDEPNDASLGAIGTSLPSRLEQSPTGVEALTRTSLSSSELLELGTLSAHYSATVPSSAQFCEGHMYRTSLPIPVAPGGHSSTGLFSSSDSTTCSSHEPSSSSALAANSNLLGNIMAWFHDMNPQGITLVPPTSSDTDANLCALHTEDEDESLQEEQDKSAVVITESKQALEAEVCLSALDKECVVAERPTQLELVQLEPLPLHYPSPQEGSAEPQSEAQRPCHVDTPQCDSVCEQLPSTSSSEWEEQVHLV